MKCCFPFEKPLWEQWLKLSDTYKHLRHREEGSYTIRSHPFLRLPSAPTAHLSASQWISQPCLWSMEMTDNNMNTLKDATCDSPPAVWLGQLGEGQKERADKKKNTVLPGHNELLLQKKERSAEVLWKQQWLSDPPCRRRSESRTIFDQSQQGWSEPVREIHSPH